MRSIWIVFIAAILALTAVGCGGGGGNSSGTTSYSSDYFGLEKGFETVYSNVEIENGKTTTDTLTTLVMGETAPQSGIYKVTTSSAAPDAAPLGYRGDYVQKKGNSYYDYGEWEGTVETKQKLPPLILESPITLSQSLYYKATVTGQETVSVPAGTFEAWVFEENESYDIGFFDEPCNYSYKVWFVPTLGPVKSIETYIGKNDGKTLSSSTSQLESYARGVSVKK